MYRFPTDYNLYKWKLETETEMTLLSAYMVNELNELTLQYHVTSIIH